MASKNRGAMIRAIFSAYMTNDRKVVEDSLADDFRFTSPYDDRIDKASYFARCWKNSDWIERHELREFSSMATRHLSPINAPPGAARASAIPSSLSSRATR
jgi:hypothetical protein